MTIGPPAPSFSTVHSTLADALGRHDGLASYRDLDALYWPSWRGLPHLAGTWLVLREMSFL